MERHTISGRQLRHGAPEETLAPGESLTIKKRDGKRFELRRIDGGKRSMAAALNELLSEVPTQTHHPVNLSRIIIEDRE
jgi:hypothetical protein